MHKSLLGVVALLSPMVMLGACGQRGELHPKTVKAPPPAYGRDQPQSVSQLLTPPAQAAPEHSVELHTKSEPREDDPFNLPPKG